MSDFVGDWHALLVLVVAGFLPNEVWRMIGLWLGGGVDEGSEVLVWVRAVATAILAGVIVAGDVIVVRNVGPVGGPGMPEMVLLTIQLQGRGLGEDVALITDGRFSGVSHGILIGHISPEAARGGPIAAVRDGDAIVIDPGTRTLTLDVSDDEINRRMAGWRAPERADKARPGSVHDKYIRLVSSAHCGCIV